MRANHIPIEECNLSTQTREEVDQDLSGGGFACARETSKPDTESLLMTRAVGFRQNLGDFRAHQPHGRRVPVREAISEVGSRQLDIGSTLLNPSNILVPVLLRKVDELIKRKHLYADLLLILAKKFLGSVGIVERSPMAVFPRAGMVPSNDKVVGTVVPPDDAVP